MFTYLRQSEYHKCGQLEISIPYDKQWSGTPFYSVYCMMSCTDIIINACVCSVIQCNISVASSISITHLHHDVQSSCSMSQYKHLLIKCSYFNFRIIQLTVLILHLAVEGQLSHWQPICSQHYLCYPSAFGEALCLSYCHHLCFDSLNCCLCDAQCHGLIVSYFFLLYFSSLHFGLPYVSLSFPVSVS